MSTMEQPLFPDMEHSKYEFSPVAGVRLGTACAGIKKAEHRDLVLLELAAGSQVAAVFTRNAFRAAPVLLAQRHLAGNMPRYLLVNTGYANAGTGEQGLQDAEQCCRAVAKLGGCKPEEVLPFSTGVIGEPLPVERIISALPTANAALAETGWEDAAWGIMTTDTVPKLTSRTLQTGGQQITVTGMAKGAGMIRPDMATMLAYIATDAAVEQPVLQQCLQQAVAHSFNRITVDGDTSTNDACLLIATGQGDVTVPASGEVHDAFVQLVQEVCVELAKGIIKDGEGATKLINIEVTGGQNEAECFTVAYTVAHSPLVKTAFFAADPNWGRILAAVGRAEIAALELEKVRIFLDDVCIVTNGARHPAYTEEKGRQVMARNEITVRLELGRGEAQANVWTCDFSYDYVRINAEYRT